MGEEITKVANEKASLTLRPAEALLTRILPARPQFQMELCLSVGQEAQMRIGDTAGRPKKVVPAKV